MIFVLCGLPGSGKTTLSKQLSQQYNARICCYDDCEKDYVNRTYAPFYSFICKQKEENENIIIDNINLTIKSRMELLEILKIFSDKKILIILTTSLDQCISRAKQRERITPEFIIRALNSQYQSPSLDEGWDDIWYV